MRRTVSPVAIRSLSQFWMLVRVGSVQKMRKIFDQFACATVACVALSAGAMGATYAVNVSLPSAALAKDLLANATNQYIGTITPSAYFANTWTLTLTGKNPNYNPPPPPVSSTPTVDATQLLGALVAVSTSTYPYGWADGMEYGRYLDLGRVSYYDINCSSPTVFDPNVSSATWSVVTCNTALGVVHDSIYQLNLATPTVVPGGP